MSTLLQVEGFRFSFYSGDGVELPHVHVNKGGAAAKVWLPARSVACASSPSSMKRSSSSAGMSTSVASPPDPRARAIEFGRDAFVVHLEDGRSLTVPLEWFPRLRDATAEQRQDYELLGDGIAIHWPAIDEDISVPRLFGLSC